LASLAAYSPVLALLLTFSPYGPSPPPLPHPGCVRFAPASASDRSSPIAWIASQAAKLDGGGTSQGGGDAWVVHATREWSAEHIDAVARGGLAAEDAAANDLLTAVRAELAGAGAGSLPEPAGMQLKRWRFAFPPPAAADSSGAMRGAALLEVAPGLVLAGDGLAGSGDVEGAFGSGWDAGDWAFDAVFASAAVSASATLD
ncbi:hypothetical protein HK405_014276, partial [Cladochytrium tenue]